MSVYIDVIDAVLKQIARKPQLSESEARDYARALGVLIFELPNRPTGLVSEAALVAKFKSGKNWTAEHMWPRQVAGYMLIELAQDGYTRTDLVETLHELTEVNFVTTEENKRLQKFQRADVFVSPEHAYHQANISLREWPKQLWIRHLPRVYPDLL